MSSALGAGMTGTKRERQTASSISMYLEEWWKRKRVTNLRPMARIRSRCATAAEGAPGHAQPSAGQAAAAGAAAAPPSEGAAAAATCAAASASATRVACRASTSSVSSSSLSSGSSSSSMRSSSSLSSGAPQGR